MPQGKACVLLNKVKNFYTNSYGGQRGVTQFIFKMWCFLCSFSWISDQHVYTL